MSESKNIFELGMNLANEIAPTISESINHQVEIKNIDSHVDSVIAHTVAMFVICCSLNADVLDSKTLEKTFEQVKGVIKTLRDASKGIVQPPEETIN